MRWVSDPAYGRRRQGVVRALRGRAHRRRGSTPELTTELIRLGSRTSSGQPTTSGRCSGRSSASAIQLDQNAASCYRTGVRNSRRSRPSLELAPRRGLRLPRLPGLRPARGGWRRSRRSSSSRARASACSATKADSRFAEPVPISRAWTRGDARAGDRRAGADHQQDERRVHRCTGALTHGLHRREEARRVTARSTGEHRFIGLFTSKAYAEPAGVDPDPAPKLEGDPGRDLEVQEGSHDYKEIITIFDSTAAGGALPLVGGGGGRGRPDRPDGVRRRARCGSRSGRTRCSRGTSVMVILPQRTLFSARGTARHRASALVERFDGEVLNYHLSLGEGRSGAAALLPGR